MRFEEIEIGMKIGPFVIEVTDEYLREHVGQVQWDIKELPGSKSIAPPGLTIGSHPFMERETFGAGEDIIWAKSEHEFIHPIKVGSKLIKHGKIVNKYVKRGKGYVVMQIETFDEQGQLLMRSRETNLFLAQGESEEK